MRPTITAFTIAELVEHTRAHPENWAEFVAGLGREYARTGDPELAAKIAAAAMRLALVVPPWAATWLADGLERKVRSGTDLDTGLGYKGRAGGKGTSLAKKREQQRDRDFIVLVMKVLRENHKYSVDDAAKHTAKMLEKNFGKKLDVGTIIDRWNHGLRKEASALPPIRVDSRDE